jgi:hypothetical protein
MTRGLNNLRIANARQAKTFNTKTNIRFTLLSNNASICFDKQYKAYHLAPTYSQININDYNNRNRKAELMVLKYVTVGIIASSF